MTIRHGSNYDTDTLVEFENNNGNQVAKIDGLDTGTFSSIVKSGGTSNQCLMGDGSVYQNTFQSDFVVRLTTGTFGKYKNGDTVPAAGKTTIEVILDAAIE